MDTMTYKHELFFGPLASDYFGIEDKDTFQKEWEEINLYSHTRGVNRYVGLVLTLEAVNYPAAEIENLKKWVDETSELSNNSLEKEIQDNPSDDLKKALAWSEDVNKSIANATGHDQPFDGVKEALAELNNAGSVYVVSSANREAVEEEWKNHGLIEYVEDLYCQDRGKKADVIDLLKNKLDPDMTLMIGDSPGDLKAAQANDVSFYPIIVNKEDESWSRLKGSVLDTIKSGEYGQEEEKYIEEFWANLN